MAARRITPGDLSLQLAARRASAKLAMRDAPISARMSGVCQAVEVLDNVITAGADPAAMMRALRVLALLAGAWSELATEDVIRTT